MLTQLKSAAPALLWQGNDGFILWDGQMMIATDLDLTLGERIEKPSVDLKELADCLVALQKQTYNCGMITFLSSPSAEITAPESMDWTLDGEQQKGMEHIEIQCLHKKLQLRR